MAEKNNNDNKKSSPEEVRLAALLRSRERTEPLVPILRKLTELEIEDNKRFYLTVAAEQYRRMRRNAEDIGVFRRTFTPIYEFERLKELEDLSLGIGLPTTLNGASCIYTATDNYGDKCRVSGNLTFYDNPNKYGFKEISSDEMLPGDLVQSFNNGIPVHSLIFDSYDDSGVPLYNYSKGGEGKGLYVVRGQFPMKQSKVYRYIGFDNEKANGGIINRFNLGGPVGGIVPKGYGQPNFNLTSKINPSKVGIPSGGSGAGSGFLSNLGSSITGFLGSGLGINMLSNAAFGLLNPNGNSTGVGNALLSIGGLASNIPGVGGIVGAGVGAVGGLVNTMFGSNINEENVALFRNLNKQQMNYTSNASTNEELLADFGSMLHLGNVSRKDVGSDGWFSNKAKKLTRKINAERLRANLAAVTSLGNTALTIDTTNDLLKEYNYVAYGGPINRYDYGGNIADFINNDLTINGINTAFRGFSEATGGQNLSIQNSLGRGSGSGWFGVASKAGMTTYDLINGIRNITKSERQPLAYKIGLYEDGGSLNKYMNLGTAALNLTENAINETKIEDTTDLEHKIKERGFTEFSGSNDDLINQFGSTKFLNPNVTARDLRDKSYFDDFLTSVPASFEGFNAGSSFGPWGAAIGGVVGGASSVIGSLIGRDKAKDKAKELNAEIQRSNNLILSNFYNAVKTNNENLFLNNNKNYSSYGGPIDMKYTGTMSPFGNLFKDGGIYIKPENRGKFTALKERTGKSATWFKEHGTPSQKKMATFELNAKKWKHGGGGPLEELTPQEKLNIALGRTPSGRPLEQGLINVYPEMVLMPFGSLNTVGNISSNLGLSFGKKAAVKGLRALDYTLRGINKLDKKVDKTIYKTINKTKNIAVEKAPKFENTINETAKALKLAYFDTKRFNLWPSFFYSENDEPDSKKGSYQYPLREGYEEYAFGGELTHGGIFSNGILEINTGGTHELNPYEGIQVGVDEQNVPNLVEEGELIWNDYVFSNRLNVPKSVRLKYKLRNTKDLKFAEAARKLLKESEERPNDPISLNGLNAALSRLAMEQELIRMKKELRLNRYAEGGELGNLYKGTGSKSNFLLFKKKSYPDPFTTPNFSLYAIKDPFKIPLPRYTTPDFSVSLLEPNASSLEGYMSNIFEPISKDIFNTKVTKTKESSNDIRKFREDPLRYAPILGHTAGVFSDLFSKPDYLAADEIRNIELNPSLVGFTSIANKLRYKPMDILRFLNPLNALASALRRNIMNISGGNRAIAMAGLLNVDQNLGNQVGLALISADEYNLASEERREAFNRATAQYNAEMGLKAAMANAESRNAIAKARYERDKVAALLSQLARDAYNTRRSNNLNILLEDLGNLGRERNNRNWLDILADKGIIKMNTKGEHVSSNTGKNGGKLNRKKKGGFTYA